MKCSVEDQAGCTDKEKGFIKKMQDGGAEKIAAQFTRLDGMKGGKMAKEQKSWLFQRLNILGQVSIALPGAFFVAAPVHASHETLLYSPAPVSIPSRSYLFLTSSLSSQGARWAQHLTPLRRELRHCTDRVSAVRSSTSKGLKGCGGYTVGFLRPSCLLQKTAFKRTLCPETITSM